ncbi:unnamed protein product [Alopecurus aequalis]
MSTTSSSSPAGNIGGDDGSSLTSSAIVAHAVSGSHVLKIDGYSRTKGLGNGEHIESDAFAAGGHLKAEFTVSLLDQDRQPVPLYTRRAGRILAFSSKKPAWCFFHFIKRKDLEESLYLREDAFSIRCDITVPQKIFTEPISPSVVVPPSNLHQHLGNLLFAGEAADIAFEQLLVQIDDMEAQVFRALLHYIYTDSLPTTDEGDGVEMAQHLLVAADRYNLERLKLICEGRLCDHICRGTVATTMALAEQHGCAALKNACFKFLTSPGNLKVVMASDGFEHLKRSCPSVLEELVAKLLLLDLYMSLNSQNLWISI